MGVKGLWKLLEPAKKIVALESLSGLILAVVCFSSEPACNIAEDDNFFSSDQSDVEFSSEDQIDFESNNFSSLPFSLQHEILLAARDQARYVPKECERMPEDSSRFSDFQLKNLLNKSRINRRLDDLCKNIVATSVELHEPADHVIIQRAFHGDQKSHVLLEISPRKSQTFEPTQNMKNVPKNIVEFDIKSNDELFTQIQNNFDDSSAIEPSSSNDVANTVSKKSHVKNSVNFEKIDAPVESKICISSPEDKSDGIDDVIDDFAREKEIPAICLYDVIEKAHSNVSHDRFLPDSGGQKNCDVIPTLIVPSKFLSISDENSSAKHLPTGLREVSSSDDDDFVEVEEKSCEMRPTVNLPHVSVNLVPKNDAHNEKMIETTDFGAPEKSEDFRYEDVAESLQVLRHQKRKAEAMEKSMTSEIMAECKNLIELFGLPCVNSPGEAEAQCVHLEGSEMCHGIISDDSDVWLFGGRKIFRHLFDKRRYVEKYEIREIEKQLGLDRKKLIKLALLIGCDYTEGLNQVGVVTGLEILSEFKQKFTKNSGDLDDLREFRCWYEQNKNRPKPPENTVRCRLLNLDLKFPDSFPDQGVYDAFALCANQSEFVDFPAKLPTFNSYWSPDTMADQSEGAAVNEAPPFVSDWSDDGNKAHFSKSDLTMKLTPIDRNSSINKSTKRRLRNNCKATPIEAAHWSKVLTRADDLRNFAASNFHWSAQKINDTLTPALNRWRSQNERTYGGQTSIKKFAVVSEKRAEFGAAVGVAKSASPRTRLDRVLKKIRSEATIGCRGVGGVSEEGGAERAGKKQGDVKFCKPRNVRRSKNIAAK